MDTYAEGKLDVEGLHMLVVRAESIVNTRRTDTTESELLLVTLDSRISADHQMSNEVVRRSPTAT